MSSNRLRLLLLSVMAVVAISAVASASASAAPTCYKVAVAGTGTFENNACTVTGGTKEYIKITKLAKEIKPGEWCAQVAKPTGKYSNEGCTEEKAGATEKEYIKVMTFKRIFEVCQKGGTEKKKDHTCAGGEVAGGEWSWLPIPAGTKFAVESAGNAFKLEGGGLSSDCTAVTNTGEIGPGGASINVTLKFTGCTHDPGTCEAFSVGKAGTKEIEVTGLTDQLVERKTSAGVIVLADEFKENAATHQFVTIEFKEGANPCPNYPATKVKGQVAGECKNITVAGQGETELFFPTPVLKENSLEAFGVKASLFGTATVSLVNKWSLRCV